MEIAIILGTSRADGNTRKVVDSFIDKSGATLFDLEKYDLSFFDYGHKNINDDFLPLINELICFDHLVFASPVYWYSVSAQLKVFIDRFTDLLTIEKGLGRKLKGKEISIISTGFEDSPRACFSEPIELTANYLRMKYRGNSYCSIKNELNIENLNSTLKKAMANVTYKNQNLRCARTR